METARGPPVSRTPWMAMLGVSGPWGRSYQVYVQVWAFCRHLTRLNDTLGNQWVSVGELPYRLGARGMSGQDRGETG